MKREHVYFCLCKCHYFNLLLLFFLLPLLRFHLFNLQKRLFTASRCCDVPSSWLRLWMKSSESKILSSRRWGEQLNRDQGFKVKKREFGWETLLWNSNSSKVIFHNHNQVPQIKFRVPQQQTDCDSCETVSLWACETLLLWIISFWLSA